MKKSVSVVIPVNTLGEAKTRLSRLLSKEERMVFTIVMFEDVLEAVTSSIVEKILVIGKDDEVRYSAQKFGVRFLFEEGKGLNEAVEQAVRECGRKEASSVLILPSDIPLINQEDVNGIIRMEDKNRCIVISPSNDGGTNALLQKPPRLIRSQFGHNSFLKHLQAAHSINVPVRIYRSQRITLDIDSIEDLKKFMKLPNQTKSHSFLERINLTGRLRDCLSWPHLTE